MKQITITLTFFYTSFVFSQTEKEIKINISEFNTSGNIIWTTVNEKDNTTFIIEEFRWEKWETIGQLKGKGTGNNSYSFLADTMCGIYQIRINAKDSKDNYSKIKKYPNKKNVEIIKSELNIRFNTKTKYEIYDRQGLKITSGCDNYINLRKLDLKSGSYFLHYGFNTMGEFLTKGTKTENSKPKTGN